jgi:heat shock protein HslJ
VTRAVFLACVVLVAACGGEEEGAATGAPGLEGVPWMLTSGGEHAPSATFADGTVAGSSGCNRYTATYTLDGDRLKIGPAITTKMACGPPADTIERGYLAALERVATWRVDDGELVLADTQGKELLRFREASIVGAWIATMFLQAHRDAVSSPLEGTEVTATFGEDGKLTGSAGCNTYEASYTTDRSKIKISDVTATDKACDAPIMEQEQAYLSALPLAVSYTIEGTQLSLLTAAGTYVAAYQLSS